MYWQHSFVVLLIRLDHCQTGSGVCIALVRNTLAWGWWWPCLFEEICYLAVRLKFAWTKLHKWNFVIFWQMVNIWQTSKCFPDWVMTLLCVCINRLYFSHKDRGVFNMEMSVPLQSKFCIAQCGGCSGRLSACKCSFMSLQYGSLHDWLEGTWMYRHWRKSEDDTKVSAFIKTHPLIQFQIFREFSPTCFLCVQTYYFILANYKLYCLFE